MPSESNTGPLPNTKRSLCCWLANGVVEYPCIIASHNHCLFMTCIIFLISLSLSYFTNSSDRSLSEKKIQPVPQVTVFCFLLVNVFVCVFIETPGQLAMWLWRSVEACRFGLMLMSYQTSNDEFGFVVRYGLLEAMKSASDAFVWWLVFVIAWTGCMWVCVFLFAVWLASRLRRAARVHHIDWNT